MYRRDTEVKTHYITATLLSLIIVLVALSFGVGLVDLFTPEKKPTPLQVVDKYEGDGKYYVETWVEVDVNDYIGLDIGDEFEVE